MKINGKNEKTTRNHAPCSMLHVSCFKAFSFVEVMISVFLLSVGMIAIITLMSGNLRDSLDSRNQVIAAGLAQEGIELVKNVRDTNWLVHKTNPVVHSFDGFPNTASGTNCTIDYTLIGLGALNCNPASNILKIDNNSFYNHTGVTDTRFQRKLVISDSVADKNVISMVIWGGSFPPDFSTCNTSTKCAYAQLTLTTYGE